MGKQCNSNLPRAISVADFILEDGGHSIKEAAEEFRVSTNTIQRDLNYLGAVAFYSSIPREDLKVKYLQAKDTIAKVGKISRHNSIIAKKTTSN